MCVFNVDVKLSAIHFTTYYNSLHLLDILVDGHTIFNFSWDTKFILHLLRLLSSGKMQCAKCGPQKSCVREMYNMCMSWYSFVWFFSLQAENASTLKCLGYAERMSALWFPCYMGRSSVLTCVTLSFFPRTDGDDDRQVCKLPKKTRFAYALPIRCCSRVLLSIPFPNTIVQWKPDESHLTGRIDSTLAHSTFTNTRENANGSGA